MKHYIYVSRSKRGLGHPESAALIKRAVRMALKSEEVDFPCRINVLLTDDEEIREINRENRNVDSATDVLSFPMNELKPGEFDSELCEYDFETESVLLGDMVISIPHCESQGIEFGHGYEREVMYLTVHSVLHLLGYDHIDEGEMKKQMRTREKLIMGDE